MSSAVRALDPSHLLRDRVFGANVYLADEDATQEECEERNPVLSHGVRRVGHWYENIARIPHPTSLD